MNSLLFLYRIVALASGFTASPFSGEVICWYAIGRSERNT